MSNTTFVVQLGGLELGEIRDVRSDQPFDVGRFTSNPDFMQYREEFQLELKLLESDRMDEWIHVYQRILDRNLSLVDKQKGTIYESPILHIRSDEAWFRL